ncbi:DUF2628 domain-containing protein [Methylopila musalis]|uniref:DUF2628 domain-containing protein n=1 Tax=Methylopila musalis TaxID=1134781 RepID=A0ABW3Z6Y8_9HYPH
MNTWLIYQPAGDERSIERAEGFVTFREGFHKIAFLMPVIWLIWRRCWLALALYVAVEIALMAAAGALRMDGGRAILFALLPNLAVGFEAAWLRARSLERRGYRYAGSVLTRSREEAEIRFFSDWAAEAETPPAPRAPAVARPSTAPAVLGFFPEAAR